ncbi:Outer membrane protein (OmpH-like) [Fibrobacter sp. UWH9]|uniref:OmpH family outer membrane protein n=1 Tax=unclassified Fibrobacter TaxID=2634177 RepID=UPI00091F1219|nr:MULTISPECIES: OmpH family outer membrane protein [Fibrobacter]MCL4103375.1 hypothetical protein [Fibrobacter succinogenes]SHH87992.1 Outer membrane protein (OmpH-like) [Fibrobacter sp. UWH9]
MNKLSVVALLLSLLFVGIAFKTLANDACYPYFIDSTEVLAADQEMQAINRKIGLQDEILKKKEQNFTDSIMGLFDSTSVRNEKYDALVELLNLESNVYRHNMIDSISKASQAEVEEAVKKFNEKVAEYCKRNGFAILFGSNDNSVVYGTGTKADKTKELITYIGGINE